MSRIGKKPVPVPKGVTATIDGQTVKVKGPKGELSLTLVDDVTVKMGETGIEVAPRDDSKRARSMWGMSRSLVDNLVNGVGNGFSRTLEITGVGYRAALKGTRSCSSSSATATTCSIRSRRASRFNARGRRKSSSAAMTRRSVGQVAAEIRRYRKPEPYKGKGVRYAGEFIFRKEGKKKK